VHRLTVTQLAAVLAAEPVAGRGLAPVSALGREALAARVAYHLRRRGEMRYFEPVAAMPGFPRALAATLAELRLNGVDAEALAGTGAPGRDLAALLGLYERELRERSLADLPELLRLAAGVARGRRHGLLDLPLLLLYAPSDSAAEREFLEAVAGRAPAVLAVALSGDELSIAALERMVHARAESADAAASSSTLDRLRASLFASQAAPAPPPDDSVEFFSAPGEGLEAAEIARRLLRLGRQGVAFDRMAILLRNPERYQPLVEEALRRAGIPGYFSRGSARPDPAGRALLALLACAAEGCTATRFAEYLSLGQVPELDETGAPARADAGWVPPDDELWAALHGAQPEREARPEEGGGSLSVPFGWERLLVDAAVIGGRERWERRLRGLGAEFRLQLEELAGDDAAREHVARQLHRLRALERFALPLIEMLAALPRSASWGEWLERLAGLAETALRRPESVLAVLNELQPMREVGPADLDEVAGVLSDRLRFLRREPPGRPYGRVFVGTIEEARGRAFDAVFLPGLAEGLFPRRALEDPLLLDAPRRALHGGLRVQEHRVAAERLLLRTAAAAAGRLLVSYPRIDTAQGRPRVPSFYAMEIVRAAEGSLPDLRAFEQRAMRAAPARLGWPAPVEEQEAIDDAEYDLAWLARCLRMPPGQAKGRGRYLVEVNPHLARSLRTRGRRWRNFWSGADGIVEPDPAAAAILARHRLAARAYSASSLQQFAACPYRFVLHAIHQLRPREQPVPLERMDPLTRGSLFHEAQFELFREIAEGAEGDILDLADRVLDRVAARYAEELAPAIPRVWSGEVEELRKDLRGWIGTLRHSLAEWEPMAYEYAFGMPLEDARDPHSTEAEAVVLDGVRLRGSVDLVERHRSRGTLRVTDHKTGRPALRAPRFVGGGAVLQPLLYSLAAECLLEQPVESGRLFYCTERGGFREVTIPVTDEARLHIRRAVGAIDQAIRDGFLPAAPQAEACDTCDYRPVCGPYEERRVRYKKRAPLEPLVELRSTP
jgi:CRISPR/Cas system-associated exonuclease Cas4 (RecB family)